MARQLRLFFGIAQVLFGTDVVPMKHRSVDAYVEGMMGRVAVQQQRFCVIIYLFLNLDEPKVVQSLLRSYSLVSPFQQSGDELLSLTTEACLNLR